MSAVLTVPVRDIERIDPQELRTRVTVACASQSRLLSFYGTREREGVALTAVLEAPSGLSVLRSSVVHGGSFMSLTPDLPAAHIFEREIHESCGLTPKGHPWLKPVRANASEYRFFSVEGKEVHEVGVGPIHAGVIEPGHFRFMCQGETVEHLEIQLGYQHRGVEKILASRPLAALASIVELIAGDSSAAYAWAFAGAVEGLSGTRPSPASLRVRGLALELERVAMHLAGLAGLAADIGYLPASSAYGRIRTAAINASMLVCGSRFGRSWIRPGGVRAVPTEDQRTRLADIVRAMQKDLAIVNEAFRAARTVRHRLEGTGTVSKAMAMELGAVGLAARASGLGLDARIRHADEPYRSRPVEPVVESGGDCWARALVRIREMDVSLAWIASTLATPFEGAGRAALGSIAPETLAVSVCEGWRGEVVHCIETGAEGAVRHYRVQDPSLRNWMALAMAVRGNAISDFPICNKSFDLSYCGNDL